jgi:UDP-N-acetylmuramoylalanine--D-glutamate ligase
MKAARTVVAGLGASGLATARYLTARGDDVIVLDSRADPPGLAALSTELPGVRIELGTLDPRWLDGAERLVVSPGLMTDIPLIGDARQRGIEVVGELELFARVAPAPVIAVTGSNGKSTVTTLTARMLAARGLDVLAGGNLGPPALDLLDSAIPDFYVLEVSSFQLETTESLRPRVAAVLNVTADHIDRHGSLEAYAAIKSQLLAAADTAVFNHDDRLVSLMARSHRDVVPFSVAQTLTAGWSILDDAGERWLARDGAPVMRAAELALAGTVGEANALAALALTERCGGDPRPALDVLRQFEGLPHRLQHVAKIGGVDYVDDSKGTNVGASTAAILSMGRPVVLIAGGLAKGADFAPLADVAEGRLRAAILIGQAAEALDGSLGGVTRTVRAATLEAAVRLAAGAAEPGDVVLLSPACASQDMFRDYRERGERFARAVAELAR